jgi:hypothetical protein
MRFRELICFMGYEQGTAGWEILPFFLIKLDRRRLA